MTLEPSNTDTWDAWIEPTSQQPLFMKFTFFNVENEDEIVANNTKPRVTEKGAFAYREVRICFEGKPFMKNFNKSFNDLLMLYAQSGEKEGACSITLG